MSARQVSWRAAQTQSSQRTLAGRQSHESRHASHSLPRPVARRALPAPCSALAGRQQASLPRERFFSRLMSEPAEESASAKLLQEISGNVTRRAHPRDVKASPVAAGSLREAYSKMRLRVKREAPFAPLATARSSLPWSS